MFAATPQRPQGVRVLVVAVIAALAAGVHVPSAVAKSAPVPPPIDLATMDGNGVTTLRARLPEPLRADPHWEVLFVVRDLTGETVTEGFGSPSVEFDDWAFTVGSLPIGTYAWTAIVTDGDTAGPESDVQHLLNGDLTELADVGFQDVEFEVAALASAASTGYGNPWGCELLSMAMAKSPLVAR